MDKLPVELITKIIHYLGPEDLAHLQLVSRSLCAIARDNNIWREQCYLVQRDKYDYRLNLRGLFGLPNLQDRFRWANSSGANGSSPPTSSNHAESHSMESAILWDPSEQGEGIDWYTEYIARHGPTSITWLRNPGVEAANRDLALDVKGMGILEDRSYGAEDQIIAPLEDGSVAVWDFNHADDANGKERRGKAIRSSRPTLLLTDRSRPIDTLMQFGGAVECVSIDSISKRAYIAVENVLNEVDLHTLQLISQKRHPQCVFALSQETSEYRAPLTVATRDSLHLHDPRSSPAYHQPDKSLSLDSKSSFALATKSLPFSPMPAGTVDYADLFGTGPNFVLHPPLPSINSIVVAGRFSSVLLYDRRNIGRLQASAHSGARLCGLAALPSIPKRYRTPDDLSGPNQSIIACGEHKGFGSLELYALSARDAAGDWGGAPSPMLENRALYRNRHISVRSKILSVATHGARIVCSDSSGNIKWTERDGKTIIREFDINASSPTGPRYNMHETMGGQVQHMARKIVPTRRNLDHDELLIWTGARLGRVRFSRHVEEDPAIPDEASTRDEEYRAALGLSLRESMHMSWPWASDLT
ncbi:F-box domain-containing protein [Arthroderma uncinatum]|uniref:F-box domain-containing protein n=1 Tax=Arthroderma uncinatum TaxID=74035 RepID=UPI00144A69A1|nr:F-box domain-containing protein [Arthroderma uncinatum]KAF3490523.1 F-box domain-containing protein [Arthroderma uncinatum]